MLSVLRQCINVVRSGAEDGCAKVASDFYKLEQLAAESAKLQEEKWNQ